MNFGKDNQERDTLSERGRPGAPTSPIGWTARTRGMVVSDALLHCPVRDTLNVPERAEDGFTFTEEKRRIDCINHLLSKGFPPNHIRVETTLWRFGSQGKNSFRTDIVVLDRPASVTCRPRRKASGGTRRSIHHPKMCIRI